MSMVALLLPLVMNRQEGVFRSSRPFPTPELEWKATGPIPSEPIAGEPIAGEPRNLVLSNGPEILQDWIFSPSRPWSNLYWGRIPFEGSSLKLRLYVYHLLDPKAKFDSLEVEVCMGVENGADKPVRVVRNVFTRLNPPEDDPKQYVVPGRSLAIAHLSNRYAEEGPKPVIPSLTAGGDVLGLGLRLQREPAHRQFQALVGELDLEAAPVSGRFLVLRTVAHKSGTEIGTMVEATPAHPGLGERGWWPVADVYQRLSPLPVTPAYAKLLDRGKGAWNLFNRFDSEGKPKTNNLADKYGTKNSGLWGVNVELQFENPDAKRFDLTICGLHTDWPAGFAMLDPATKLGKELPFLNRRSAVDYDCFKLKSLGEGQKQVSLSIAPAGSSVFPVGLIFDR